MGIEERGKGPSRPSLTCHALRIRFQHQKSSFLSVRGHLDGCCINHDEKFLSTQEKQHFPITFSARVQCPCGRLRTQCRSQTRDFAGKQAKRSLCRSTKQGARRASERASGRAPDAIFVQKRSMGRGRGREKVGYPTGAHRSPPHYLVVTDCVDQGLEFV